jgi:hypothetical protein
MTRENLLAVAKKYNLTSGWRGLVSGTEIVDFIRERTKIEPLDIKLGGRQQQAIAFTVGFEYENPQIATRVANELLTMILNEDVSSRAAFASEATKFLALDVERIEEQLGRLNTQIADLQKRAAASVASGEAGDGAVSVDTADAAKQLAALKSQLAVKSAIFASSHPNILELKRAIKSLEDAGAGGAKPAPKNGAPDNPEASNPLVTAGGNIVGIDALETRRESLKTQLTRATQKLAAARLGENLERGRHSQRLVVLEQPVPPIAPVSPNRIKLFMGAFVFAFMAGAGLVVAREMSDQAIRSREDILSIIDNHLIVSIPYISTQREGRQRKKNIILVIAIMAASLLLAAAAAYLFLPPPDIWYDLATDKLMKLLLK